MVWNHFARTSPGVLGIDKSTQINPSKSWDNPGSFSLIDDPEQKRDQMNLLVLINLTNFGTFLLKNTSINLL